MIAREKPRRWSAAGASISHFLRTILTICRIEAMQREAYPTTPKKVDEKQRLAIIPNIATKYRTI